MSETNVRFLSQILIEMIKADTLLISHFFDAVEHTFQNTNDVNDLKYLLGDHNSNAKNCVSFKPGISGQDRSYVLIHDESKNVHDIYLDAALIYITKVYFTSARRLAMTEFVKDRIS